ncbi:transposase [Desulfovibrio desulfuricans]|nr:transposase [Desulfovibrio desulfuricans]
MAVKKSPDRGQQAPSQSFSLVARTYGVAPILLYRWRKQMSEGGKAVIGANAVGREKNSSRGCPYPAWRISSEKDHGRPGGVPIQHLLT